MLPALSKLPTHEKPKLDAFTIANHGTAIGVLYDPRDCDMKQIYVTTAKDYKMYGSGPDGSFTRFTNLGTIVSYEWGNPEAVAVGKRYAAPEEFEDKPVIVSITLSLHADTKVPMPSDKSLMKMYTGMRLRGDEARRRHFLTTPASHASGGKPMPIVLTRYRQFLPGKVQDRWESNIHPFGIQGTLAGNPIAFAFEPVRGDTHSQIDEMWGRRGPSPVELIARFDGFALDKLLEENLPLCMRPRPRRQEAASGTSQTPPSLIQPAPSLAPLPAPPPA